MDESDVPGLSARKVEYLKFICDNDGMARTGDLAARFSVDPSTISKTIRELARDGLVSCAPYERIRLSAAGRKQAEFCIKRHRILSLLFSHYGFNHDEACREVSRFESYVSRDAVDRICRTMGHPQAAGCGVITHDTGCLGKNIPGPAIPSARSGMRSERP